MKKLPSPACLRSLLALAMLGSGVAAAAPTETRVHVRTLSDADSTPWLTAFGGGGGGVALDRPWKRAWETFTIVDLDGGTLDFGDRVGIRAANGQYLSVQVARGGAVLANRDRLGEWETFRFTPINNAAFDDTPIEPLNTRGPQEYFQIIAYDGQALTTFDARSVFALGSEGDRDGRSYFFYEQAD